MGPVHFGRTRREAQTRQCQFHLESVSLSLPPYLQRALGKVRETDASLAMFHETQFNRSPDRPRRDRPPKSRLCAKVSVLTTRTVSAAHMRWLSHPLRLCDSSTGHRDARRARHKGAHGVRRAEVVHRSGSEQEQEVVLALSSLFANITLQLF